MKHFFLLSIFSGLALFCFGETYYSQGSLAADQLLSWNNSRTGAGLAPASFTNNGDIFVIQSSHSLTTSGTWTLGGVGFVLQIESGGMLNGNNPILFTGSFQIDGGGIYIHNNNASVSSVAGASIFGGTENFTDGSTFEIQNWINQATPLPAVISWGNLVINYTNSLGGNWNQQASVTDIKGNLVLKNTGTAGQEFRLTSNNNLSLLIGGNLLIENGILNIKDNGDFGTTAIVQLNGSIIITAGVLNTGRAFSYGDTELRFKGNFQASGSAVLTSGDVFAFLTANGNSTQNFSASPLLDLNLKIAQSATVSILTPISFSAIRQLVIGGTLNTGSNGINMNKGQLVINGGTLNASGAIDMKDGSCKVCTGNGNFSGSWCQTTGSNGVLNYTNATMLFERSNGSRFFIGDINSKGTVNLSNAIISFLGSTTGPVPNRGGVEMTGGSVLNFDAASYINGDAYYTSNGGWLGIAASSGITMTGNFGNIRVTGARNYNNSGINSFEFKGNLPQSTGNGLPAVVSGVLKINNSDPFGVTLTAATTIAAGGELQLTQGILKTTLSLSLTMRRNSTATGGSAASYVEGPLRKIGDHAFTFHTGRNGLYAPVKLGAGGLADDTVRVEYFPGNPQSVYGTTYYQFIDHVSSTEYWTITGKLSFGRSYGFKISPYSQVNVFSSMLVAYYDGNGWLNNGRDSVSGNTNNGFAYISAFNPGPYTFASTDPPNIICPGGNTYFTMQLVDTGYIHKWQVDAGSGFEDITNGGFYSGADTNRLVITSPPSTNYGFRYRCIATKGANIFTSETYVLRFSVSWTGAVNTQWENPSNWGCGQLPDTNTDVVVPAAISNFPVINSHAACRSILLFFGNSLTVNSGFSLSISGKPGSN